MNHASTTKRPPRPLVTLKSRRRLQTIAVDDLSSAVDTHETKEHIITPIKRLEKQGVRLYAEAAIHALQKTRDPNNPVVVNIEHIFPERFGGHPEELKWIIKKSRERMVEMLTKPEIEYGASLAPTEIDEKALREGLKQPNPYYTGVSKDKWLLTDPKNSNNQLIRITADETHAGVGAWYVANVLNDGSDFDFDFVNQIYQMWALTLLALDNTSSGSDSSVPFQIDVGETYIVAAKKQALYSAPIQNSGVIRVDGILIEVAN